MVPKAAAWVVVKATICALFREAAPTVLSADSCAVVSLARSSVPMARAWETEMADN